MKRILTSFFLLIISFVFSQEYQFDFLLKTNVNNLSTGYQMWDDYMINSSDKRYYGRFLTSYDNKNLELEVMDYKNNITVKFTIDVNADPLNPANYKFLNNGVIVPNPKSYEELSKFYFEQTFLKSTKEGKQVIIKKFKNKNSKKPLEEIIADLVPCDADLRIYSIHHNFGDTIPFIQLEGNENFYIKHAEILNKNFKGEYSLDVLKVNLKLKVNLSDLKHPKEQPKNSSEIISELKNQ